MTSARQRRARRHVGAVVVLLASAFACRAPTEQRDNTAESSDSLAGAEVSLPVFPSAPPVPSVALSGRVLWSDGTPACGASICLRLFAPADDGSTHDVRAAVAWHDASFVVLVPPGKYVIGARFERAARFRGVAPPGWCIVSPGRRVDPPCSDVEVVLDAGEPPQVAVRTDEGEPVADAVVRAWSMDVAELPLLDANVHDLEQGWPALHPGCWKIAAFAQELAPSALEARWLGGSPQRIELVLRRYARVRGTLVDASGAAIAGARVRPIHNPDWRERFDTIHPGTVSDDAGRFTLDGVLPEPTQMLVEVRSRWWSCGNELRLGSGDERDVVVVWDPANRSYNEHGSTYPFRGP